MRRIAVTAATIAITAGVLFTAAPAQADEPDAKSKSPSTGLIHHRSSAAPGFALHFLSTDSHTPAHERPHRPHHPRP